MPTALTLLRSTLLLLACLLVATPAEAQRRGRQPAEEVLFPNAQREEPTVKPAQRLQRQLKKMYDLSQEDGKDVETEAAAKELLAAPGVGPYEISLTNQILGFIELDRDNLPAAIAYLQAALDAGGFNNNQHYQIMQNIGQMQFGEEDYAAAIATLTRFLDETRSETVTAIAIRGNAFYRAERYEEAVADLRKVMALSEKPESAIAQMLMASLFELGQTDEAAAVASDLLQREPDNASLVRNLSAIYASAEQVDKSIEILQGGLDRGVTNTDRDYIELAKMYRFAEQDQRAAELLSGGLAAGVVTPSLEVYKTIGEANYFSDNTQAAVEAYGKADEFASDGEMALNQARALYELERWTEVKAAVTKAIAKGLRRMGDAYVILAAAEFGLNNEAAALSAYREAAKYPETKESAEAFLRQATRR
jgi:tetratricopeptide (TPR) repeat protein